MPDLRVACSMMQVMMVQHSMPPANMACTTEEGTRIVKQVFAAYLTAVLVNLSIHHALSPFTASLLNWLLDHLLVFLVGLNISSNRRCHCAAGTASWLHSRRMLW